jgi:AraC-like DNA-binding protein
MQQDRRPGVVVDRFAVSRMQEVIKPRRMPFLGVVQRRVALAPRQRLDRAAEQLLHGDRDVLEVAVDAGFCNHETFSCAFLRRFGMTPSAYRARGVVYVHGR